MSTVKPADAARKPVYVKRVSFGRPLAILGMSMSGWSNERDQGLTMTYHEQDGTIRVASKDTDDVIIVHVSSTLGVTV